MAHTKSIFEELAPFASMIVDQGRGVTVSDLAFASAEDRYSTCAIPLAAGQMAANQTQKLFLNNIGETGQGWTAAMTVAETNNTSGARQPSNQVYIATHCGFFMYSTVGVGTLAAEGGINYSSVAGVRPHANQMILGLNSTWNLTIGDGIKRTLGTVLEYPAGAGVYGEIACSTNGVTPAAGNAIYAEYAQNGTPTDGSCGKRKLPIPVIFPPNISVDIEVQTGAATLSLTAPIPAAAIAYRQTFNGFRMTLPA